MINIELHIDWKKYFAQDSFFGMDGILGGDLVDAKTTFVMRDKIAHFIFAGWLQLALERWMHIEELLLTLLIILAVGVGVELLELIRYLLYGWTKILSDRFSWRDLVANLAGGLLAWLIL